MTSVRTFLYTAWAWWSRFLREGPPFMEVPMRMVIKRCPHCDQLFEPDKFHPNQRYCSDARCREERRKDYKEAYNRQWRAENPNYFKEYWLAYRELK